MTKKINEAKLQELVANQVAKSISDAKENKKTKTSKAKASKTEKPTEEPKAKETKAKAKKEKVTKEVTEINKTALIEKVVSNREVKYIYPDDVNDTLTRKSWRQKVRNKLDRLERAMYRIKDQNSKEFKAAQKEYETYRKSVIKEAV